MTKLKNEFTNLLEETMKCAESFFVISEDGKEHKILDGIATIERDGVMTNITVNIKAICRHDNSKQCINQDYATGKVMYCVPPCSYCENYLKL